MGIVGGHDSNFKQIYLTKKRPRKRKDINEHKRFFFLKFIIHKRMCQNLSYGDAFSCINNKHLVQ